MDKMKKCAPVEKEKESICVFLVRPLTLKVSIEPSIPYCVVASNVHFSC